MSDPREFSPAAPLRPVLRTRESAFSYECRACGRCCRDKRIPVNPYEIARMAAGLGVGTSEFIRRYTEEGTALGVLPDRSCVFLQGKGCAVHENRPLVCRIYPLGLVTGPDGHEVVVELEPQAGSEGVRGEAGTVAEYLAAQGVPEFLAASRRYRAALERLVTALSTGWGADEAADALEDDETEAAPEILDVDRAMAVLAGRGATVPSDVDGRVSLHLAYLADLAGPAESR